MKPQFGEFTGERHWTRHFASNRIGPSRPPQLGPSSAPLVAEDSGVVSHRPPIESTLPHVALTSHRSGHRPCDQSREDGNAPRADCARPRWPRVPKPCAAAGGSGRMVVRATEQGGADVALKRGLFLFDLTCHLWGSACCFLKFIPIHMDVRKTPVWRTRWSSRHRFFHFHVRWVRVYLVSFCSFLIPILIQTHFVHSYRRYGLGRA